MGMSHTPPPIPAQPARYPELTERELEVIQAIARGVPNREIAKALGINLKTVEGHRAHALKKLNCRNNIELVKRMIRDGAVTP